MSHKETAKKSKDVRVYSKYNEWTQLKESMPKISNPQDAFSLIKGMNITNDKDALIVYANHQNRILGSEIVPIEKLDADYIAKRATMGRAKTIFLSSSLLLCRNMPKTCCGRDVSVFQLPAFRISQACQDLYLGVLNRSVCDKKNPFLDQSMRKQPFYVKKKRRACAESGRVKT